MDSMDLIARIVTALATTAVVTPLVRRLATRWSLVDQPEDRKLHRAPIPLLGGLAIIAGVMAALLAFPTAAGSQRLWGILAAAAVVAITGLWDDLRGLSVIAKLLSQLAAAAILVSIGLFVDLALPTWIDAALSILWIVGVTNAFNLLDNMDGLAAGVTATAALGFLALSAPQGGLAPALAAGLCGAALGFLSYNFHPAKIFMGDAGSLFLGLLLAVLGLELQTGQGVSKPWVAALVPILVLAVPIFDTTLVTVSRWRRGRNPLTTPGQDHLSHRLTRRGLSVPGAVLAICLAGLVCSGCALLTARSGPSFALGALAAFVLVGFGTLVRLDGPLGEPGDEIGSGPCNGP